MQSPDNDSVAVIIVNFNAGDYLQRCLKAVEVQTVRPTRTIVVDNASTDSSFVTAKQTFSWVEFISLDSNTGFAAANNHAINLADDVKWVALLNPDAFANSDWLKNLLYAAEQNPDKQFFSSKLLKAQPDDITESILDGAGDCYHQSGLVWRRLHGRQSVNGAASESQHPFFSPCAAAALYLREAVLAVGGFDEDYFCYLEDVDLVFRMRLRGYQGAHIDSAIVQHVGSGITQRDSDFSIYHGHRNLVWTYVKNMPRALLWKTLPQHLLLNLFSLVYYSFKGRPGVIFKAKWAALKGLGQQLKKRRVIQAQTKITAQQLMPHLAQGLLSPYLHRSK